MAFPKKRKREQILKARGLAFSLPETSKRILTVSVPLLGGLVEAARAAVEKNRKPSRAGRRFWELTGGIARCKECGLVINATHSTKTKKGCLYAYDYYRCSTRNRYGNEACANSNHPRAEELEGRVVWEFVFGLLTDPE